MLGLNKFASVQAWTVVAGGS